MNIGIIVISHGKFADELVNTVFSIVGKKENLASIPVISETNLDSLCEEIKQKIAEMNVDYTVLLTDMLGGTPCNASLMLCKDHGNIFIISGVNLYMLITAITLREQNLDNINVYITKLISAGKNSITDVKEKLFKKLNSIK